MPKCDFFPVKRMKGIYDYVLDFMLTLDKMKNNSTIMCTVIVFFISFNLICSMSKGNNLRHSMDVANT